MQIIHIVKSKFLPTSEFKWIDSKNVNLSKYIFNSGKKDGLKVDPKFLKVFRELDNDYPKRLLIYTIFILVMLKNSYLHF